MSKEINIKTQYHELLIQLKYQIRSTQAKAALSVNSSLIQLYWDIGKMIAENQALFEGRNNYVEQLSKDLRAGFPDMKGFSKRNIFYCRKFHLYYASLSVQQPVALKEEKQEEIPMQQPVALEMENSIPQSVSLSRNIFSIPWGHHVILLDKANSVEEALFYMQQTIENNWSRAILILQLELNLFARQGKSITNFNQTLPEKQALLASQILKDPYNFGFLTLESKMQELDVERQLTQHITKFLLELGKGFAFIGRQYPLQIGDKDYRLDLLFYHIRLRCFVVIDLKVVEFQPEFAGKMNFYLSAVDEQIKTADDQSTIGIILCKNKNKLEVEYALKGMSQPIGVSDFEITQALPVELRNTLPTVEEFENELNIDNE